MDKHFRGVDYRNASAVCLFRSVMIVGILKCGWCTRSFTEGDKIGRETIGREHAELISSREWWSVGAATKFFEGCLHDGVIIRGASLSGMLD